MTLDKSGELWRGEDFADLADYLRHFQAEGYLVDQVVESVCALSGSG
jgi:erythromycin esterase-like protein